MKSGSPASFQDAADLVIGVDGGGSKTIAWLDVRHATGSVSPLGVGIAGPGNPRAAGFATAQDNISIAIGQAFNHAGLPRTPVAAACFGLSGAGRKEEQTLIHDWAIEQKIASTILVTHDAETILAAAQHNDLPDHGGVALIAGTGSIAWGRNADGMIGRSGGWGYLIGDEGSGYSISLAGLRAAVKAVDGRGPQTHLLPKLLDALDLTDPAAIVGRIYHPETTRDQIAQLAPIVFECAESDGVASEIVVTGSEELAQLVSTLARRLNLVAGKYPLAMTGSVLVHQHMLRHLLCEALAAAHIAPGHVEVVEAPVRGAIHLARRLLPA